MAKSDDILVFSHFKNLNRCLDLKIFDIEASNITIFVLIIFLCLDLSRDFKLHYNSSCHP